MDPFIEHFDTIKRLYIDEGRKAKDIKPMLEALHGFPTLKSGLYSILTAASTLTNA